MKDMRKLQVFIYGNEITIRAYYNNIREGDYMYI